LNATGGSKRGTKSGSIQGADAVTKVQRETGCKSNPTLLVQGIRQRRQRNSAQGNLTNEREVERRKGNVNKLKPPRHRGKSCGGPRGGKKEGPKITEEAYPGGHTARDSKRTKRTLRNRVNSKEEGEERHKQRQVGGKKTLEENLQATGPLKKEKNCTSRGERERRST